MKHTLPLKSISDNELLRRLSELLQKSRRVESELIAHISEVDQRRLYARYASSMFSFATERLHLSEHEAYLRIEVARASRKHPMLLDMLVDGRLHLSGISLLHKHLTEENRETVLARAAHKTKRQIEELAAELSPKPDVPTTIRKLPERRTEANKKRIKLGPDRVQPGNVTSVDPAVPTVGPAMPGERGPATSSTPVPTKPAVVKPIAPTRYQVQFTADTELHDKLEWLRALMHSSVPDGNLAAIIEEAVTEKIERLEAKRFGKTKNPRKSIEETDTSPSSRHIPAAVKRAVFERDKGQCTFVDRDGHRCTERSRLEFHHLKPYGRCGDHSVKNIQLACRTHNNYWAEHDYGKKTMDRYRRSSSRVSEPAAVYAILAMPADRTGWSRSQAVWGANSAPH